MIGSVQIQNYKSIRDLKFDAKRVNVFIGEPNSGKSNIIEGLALFSSGVWNARIFKEIFRFRKMPDLFYDREISNKIQITIDSISFSLNFTPPKNFKGEISRGKKILREYVFSSANLDPYQPIQDLDLGIAYYRFKALPRASDQIFGRLYPPFGTNLVALIASDHKLRKLVSDLFRSKGFRLQLDPVEAEIAMAKDVDDQFITYPYESVSETIRRVVFFMALLETSENLTLLLDEPEANTFPFYTAYLAERIALDQSNQFFLTTHNPYILGSIVSKTPVDDLAVFIVSMEKYATQIKEVSAEGLSKILDYGPDAFLNLDKLAAA